MHMAFLHGMKNGMVFQAGSEITVAELYIFYSGVFRVTLGCSSLSWFINIFNNIV